MNRRQLYIRLLNRAYNNVRFEDVVDLAAGFGFRLARIRGSHHIFVHPEVDKLLNLQDVGREAKPYQIRQLLELVEEHGLRLED